MGLYDTIDLPFKCTRCKFIEKKHGWQTKGLSSSMSHFRAGDNVPIYDSEIVNGKVEVHTGCPRCKKSIDAMVEIYGSKITDRVTYKRMKFRGSGRPWKINKSALNSLGKLMNKNMTVVKFRIHKKLKEEMDSMDYPFWDSDVRNAIERAIARKKGVEELVEVKKILEKMPGRRARKATKLMEKVHTNWIRLRA